ncbi:unnamed protein product [Prorocentrum cordatum]|uniref:Uncharacterized protein n=1 Tax=Prorocentrum cordatum TaxID=2364126 RepID=A0ABN9T071_9DINO|nr:unnamed protein product [Polarella glacialis]
MEVGLGRRPTGTRRTAAPKRLARMAAPAPARPALARQPRRASRAQPPAEVQSKKRTLGVAAPVSQRQAPKLEGLSVKKASGGPLLSVSLWGCDTDRGNDDAVDAGESSESDDLDVATMGRCGRRRTKYCSYAVQTKTRGYNHLLVSRFYYWAKQRRLGPRPPPQLDGTLRIHMTELFLSGRQANVGGKLLAGGGEGLAPSVPWPEPPPHALLRLGSGVPLDADARQALRGGGHLAELSTCYLRPSELLSVRRGHFVPPSNGVSRHWCLLLAPEELGIPTKAGVLDDSPQLDTGSLKWLDVAWKEINSRPAAERAFPSSYQELLADVRAAGATLGLELVPYQLRHSGASHDRLRDLRGLPEVMNRGRWRKLKSVVRHEKHARVGLEFGKLDALTRSHFSTGHPQTCVIPEPAVALGNATLDAALDLARSAQSAGAPMGSRQPPYL